MKSLIVDNAEPADNAFNKPLFDFVANITDCEIVNYQQLPAHRELRKNYGAVIISGVPLHYSFDSVDERLDSYRWIKRTNVPVLGICLGHQIIGKLFGGEIIRDIEAEDGEFDTHILENDPLFADITPDYKTRLMHRASVTVPKTFKVLARSDRCGNVVMKHESRKIYGLQGHPELSSSPTAAALVANFIAQASVTSVSRSPNMLEEPSIQVA